MDLLHDRQHRAKQLVVILEKAVQGMPEPASIEIVARYGRDPFLLLVSCILSLRTKDLVSLPASLALFALATTPQQLLALSTATIATTIYPVGFYRRKAQTLHDIAMYLEKHHAGIVPDTMDQLLALPGVGRKTANLVLAEGFGYPALCVDTHVHRISNRLGLVATKTPEETEQELQKVLPQEQWRLWNRLMVMWGQNICVPISPKCSSCAVKALCQRVGVTYSR